MTNTTLEDAQYCLAHPDVLHTPAQHREIIKGLLDLLELQHWVNMPAPVAVSTELPGMWDTSDISGGAHDMLHEDLSPEGINSSHGKPVWRCFGCKAETGLHWYHGWSVAMCRKPECAKAYDDLVAGQIAAEESYEAHCREIHG